MSKQISIFLISVCLMGGLFQPKYANATIFFSWNGESGYQYMGQEQAHSGGGYFSRMGGVIGGAEGNGCQDPLTYHNTVVSSEPAAQGASIGSTKALKTPYSGSCPNESFSRDTTIITTPALTEGYISWDQKWSGDWNSADVQQKFTKFYSIGGVPIVHFSFAPLARNWYAFVPNIDGHFDKDGVRRATGSIWVYASASGQRSVYAGVTRSYDDYLNGLGNGDGEFTFIPEKWYHLEFHWKVNTDANTSDAVLEAWVDGVKVFGISNFKFFNSGIKPSVNTFELQHIYYNRSTISSPTYMDNIIISDQYIGSNTSIKAPTGVTGKAIK